MKTAFIYIAIISMFSFSSFAQKTKPPKIEEKAAIVPKIPDTLIDDKPASMVTVKSYRVEENINQKFGGHTMIYEVQELSLINKNDLGPNNTRVITPRYKETKQLSNPPMEVSKNFLKSNEVIKNEIEPINTAITIPPFKEEELLTEETDTKKNEKYLYINIIKTYERVAEKGYKSVEIFQKLGDAYFFMGEYPKAAKWYEELFTMTDNLESEYYDRFAHALKKIDKKEKADEIIEKRNQLLGTAKK